MEKNKGAATLSHDATASPLKLGPHSDITSSQSETSSTPYQEALKSNELAHATASRWQTEALVPEEIPQKGQKGFQKVNVTGKVAVRLAEAKTVTETAVEVTKIAKTSATKVYKAKVCEEKDLSK